MAAPGTFIPFYATKQYIGDSTLTLSTNTFKMALVTSAWNPAVSTNAIWADISANEISSTNTGYTTGGNTLSGVTFTQTAGTAHFTCSPTSWTAGTAGITAEYAVIYASGTLNGHVNPLVGYFALDSTPANIIVSSGNTLTLNAPANGWFTLT